jgi:hypothetical protein
VGTAGYSRGTARVLPCTAAAARRAVLSCAGAYTDGADGSNECPVMPHTGRLAAASRWSAGTVAFRVLIKEQDPRYIG